MPKLCLPQLDTCEVATTLLTDPDRHLMPMGRLLRKASLDELPQLWSIPKGETSFVGLRPRRAPLHSSHIWQSVTGREKIN